MLTFTDKSVSALTIIGEPIVWRDGERWLDGGAQVGTGRFFTQPAVGVNVIT